MPQWNLSAQQLSFSDELVQQAFNRLIVVTVSDDNGAPVTGLKEGNFIAYMTVSGLPGGMVRAGIVTWPNSSEPALKEYFPGVYTISLQAITLPQTNIGPTVIAAGQFEVAKHKKFTFTQMGVTTLP